MIRLALILSLLATPVLAQVVPQPRPEGLVESAAARAAAELERRLAEERAALDPNAPAQVATSSAAPDRAAIRAQIAGAIRACWNVRDMSEEALQVRIWVAFDTTAEGEVIRESIEMTGFENGTQDAADEALGPAFRAIMRCGDTALDLPPETHPIWQRVELGFVASEVASR